MQNLIDKHICLYAYNTTGTQYHELYLRDTSYNTLESFIEYIQQQYAAGTPVTIWYVLANSTTGIVNEEGVYVPVTSEEELKDNSELKNINGGLFRKR